MRAEAGAGDLPGLRSINRPRPGGCPGGVSTTGDGGAGLLSAFGRCGDNELRGVGRRRDGVSAVWMRLRSEVRARWRSWLGLALLIGLAGGAAVAAAAGAGRTETAYPRFVQAQNGYDLVTGGSAGNIDPGRALAKIEALPEVAQWARIDVAASTAILPSGRVAPAPELMAITDLRGRAGFRLNQFKVISGRPADLRAPGEAMIDFPAADREGLRVGSIVKYIVGSPDAKRPRLAAVRIVGIVASPGQFPAVGASPAFSSVYVTPAFVRANGIRPSPGDAALLIRLRRGAAGRGAFLRQMRAAGLGGVDVPLVQQTQTAGIQRSIRLESQALWALSVLTGLAALAIVGQSLARQTYLDSADLPALRALGFSRAQLFSLGIIRAAIIGMASACVVVPVAVLLSPLTPVGLARIAEPDPGFAVDAGPLLLGAVLAAFLTVLASAIPAWAAVRTATVSREGPGPGRGRSPAFTHALSRAWRSPAAAAGVRMALQPGRGRTAVPVRSAIFGATLGAAGRSADRRLHPRRLHRRARRPGPGHGADCRRFGTRPAGDHRRGTARSRRRGRSRRIDPARRPHRDRADRGHRARPGRGAPEAGPHASGGNRDRAAQPLPGDAARRGSRPGTARLCADR